MSELIRGPLLRSIFESHEGVKLLFGLSREGQGFERARPQNFFAALPLTPNSLRTPIQQHFWSSSGKPNP